MAKKAAFAVKSRINHQVYGDGSITEMNNYHTVILFDEHGSKKFVTSMVKLAHSDTAAPEKPIRRRKTKVTKAKTTKANSALRP